MFRRLAEWYSRRIVNVNVNVIAAGLLALAPIGAPVRAVLLTVFVLTGPGMAAEVQDKLFQPFQRLHGADEGAGNGLGLAIAQRIAERHGGRITARSEPGAGAIFTIELPAGEAG